MLIPLQEIFMKTILASLILAASLSGCVVVPYGYSAEVAYEPEVIVGDYYVGYYNPGYGYWTGTGWDVDFYVVGHRGYGHYYRGAPGYARGHYRGGNVGHAHGHR
jgi:hypothetical protein